MVDDVLVLTKGSSCYFCSTYVASQYDFTQTIFQNGKSGCTWNLCPKWAKIHPRFYTKAWNDIFGTETSNVMKKKLLFWMSSKKTTYFFDGEFMSDMGIWSIVTKRWVLDLTRLTLKSWKKHISQTWIQRFCLFFRREISSFPSFPYPNTTSDATFLHRGRLPTGHSLPLDVAGEVHTRLKALIVRGP